MTCLPLHVPGSQVPARLALTILLALWLPNAPAQSPPEDFPRYTVPGHQDDMETLRALHWLHYPGAGPKATLWDEWLSAPALWPAVATNDQSDKFRNKWADTLRSRIIDDEGYVATHQHPSIAHQLGWPFPFWKQGGPGTWGWHFSLDGVPNGWHGTEVRDQTGWTLAGAEDHGIDEKVWHIRLTEPMATVSAPPLEIDVTQAPFIQLRWSATGINDARPYIEWTSQTEPGFDAARRFHFTPVNSDTATWTMIPLYKHPEWKGTITQLRLNVGNRSGGGEIGIQALFTQFDTRHNINNSNFIRGCAKYFLYTGDINFLRDQIGRMRLALRYMMTEFHTEELNVIQTDWVGHDGRPGIERSPDGEKKLLYGRGIGNNYWDLLPFGHQDTYATIQFYDAVRALARIERAVIDHPEWNIPRGVRAFDPDALTDQAAKVKAKGNDLFWNPETRRFTAGVDADGNQHDYGFTFLNLEAVHYGFATEAHARDILDWIAGDRTVAADTAQGEDIYHWRFGPRATTRRNIDYYGWYWSGPESIPWGGQVQDGGAVLGFSYFDLMSRLNVRGPDDAWNRLHEILAWYREVEAAGGYRAYYDGSRDGTLQGGGTAGGLGCDKEFFESVLVPQIMLEGFLGFAPTAEGFALNPALPSDFPELSVDRIRIRNATLTIRATHDTIDILVDSVEPGLSGHLVVTLPGGNRKLPLQKGETLSHATKGE